VSQLPQQKCADSQRSGVFQDSRASIEDKFFGGIGQPDIRYLHNQGANVRSPVRQDTPPELGTNSKQAEPCFVL
jgi:hypothetical protein